MFQHNSQKGSNTTSRSAQQPQNEFDKTVLAIFESLTEFLMLSGMGIWGLLKWSVRNPHLGLVFVTLSYYLTHWIVDYGFHLKFIRSLSPEYFTAERMDWFYQFSFGVHHTLLIGTLLFFISAGFGYRMRFIRRYYQNLFFKAGLKNNLGDTPKLITRKKLDRYRSEYQFDANGIGLSEFNSASERIVAQFKMNIESLRHGINQGRVVITFNKRKFPEKVTLSDLNEEKILPTDSFYVGYSMEGVVTQKVQELPHMLIAGTTGSGKSVFFKGCLLSLLESCQSLQMYIIDLKGGLEAIDFKHAPNVKIVKDMPEAVTLLAQVEKEMKKRFEYLAESGLKQIVPKRDRKELIIVAVDEASVLYMNRSKFDNDYASAMKARKLADSIAKLSRAAGIHLFLATQKLDKQVIPTSVSENISGRMAFRANSLQGSMVVLGNKDSSDLPEIPGRGIWSVGSKKITVQAAFVKEEEIKAACKRIAKEFKAGERKLFNPMIGELELAQGKADRSEIYKVVKKEDE
ncbi:MAG: hypothetical protein CL678_12275 [Bdellovibrionaceae bacterium]|nr:hypothetical protein [Pseudobdellovibrionaceae bacterium]|tara:strand:+ start:140 stop:1690 length:1551 start_codon:yes stop_codon:yes gene_type:complete